MLRDETPATITRRGLREMSIKRELCEECAKQLRSTDSFGGKPNEESIVEGPRCGIETMLIYGKQTEKRVNSCNRQATVRFSFGTIKAIEHISST